VTSFEVHPAARGLRGEVRVPGDKSVSHRALLLAALAEGRSELRGLSSGQDVANTLAAVAAFGAGVERLGDASVSIEGGTQRLSEPSGVIDVGNSGTGIRLLAGWAAARPGLTVLAGDESIARRPMDRVTAPLRAMGAIVDGRGGGRFPPLVVRGGDLHGIEHRSPVASAQVKGAVLLAGLGAAGATTVREEVPTRVHTEELMRAFGADVEVAPGAVTVRRSRLSPVALDIPGDPSQAAFWVVAATVVPGSELLVRNVYVGPGRAGFLEVLGRMGAHIRLEDHDLETNIADIWVESAELQGTEVRAPEITGVIDEVPILAVAAAFAEGATSFSDAAELRVKESDRIATTTAELRRLGADVEPAADGMVVNGTVVGGVAVGGMVVAGADRRALSGGLVSSHGDHRIAMTMAIAALRADAPVKVEGWEAVATSYPSFGEDLRRCVS